MIIFLKVFLDDNAEKLSTAAAVALSMHVGSFLGWFERVFERGALSVFFGIFCHDNVMRELLDSTVG